MIKKENKRENTKKVSKHQIEIQENVEGQQNYNNLIPKVGGKNV